MFFLEQLHAEQTTQDKNNTDGSTDNSNTDSQDNRNDTMNDATGGDSDGDGVLDNAVDDVTDGVDDVTDDITDDVDKAAECGFTVAESACGAPYFTQAQLVLVCRKLYADTIKPAFFLDRSCDTDCYPEHDYHTMYIAEIVEALKQD